MNFKKLLEEEVKTELEKRQIWQETLNQYYLKISNVDNWLIYERRKFINLYGELHCHLPKWFRRKD
jgi:hypothetical protein